MNFSSLYNDQVSKKARSVRGVGSEKGLAIIDGGNVRSAQTASVSNGF